MMPLKKPFTPVFLLLVTVLVGIHGTCRTRETCDNCNTELKEIEIARQMPVTYNGNERQANCIARVSVNECDGVCLSKVAPSAIRYPGFDKECRCCREGATITRHITLERCYDGAELLDGVRPTTTIKEPNSCSCQICRN